jgi:mono/diheme cytochrome c family protein
MTFRNRAAAAVFLTALIAGPAMAQTSGAEIYKSKCAMCHGPDGLATTPAAKSLKVISFKAPEKIKATDAQFITSTRDGKGKMPGYKDKLSDAQIKAVTAFVRTLQK